MDGVTLSIISLLILMILLSLGVPIAFCFSGALLFMVTFGGISMKGMMMWGLQQILSPSLLCVPLFIYAGSLMSGSGIAKYLLDFVDVFVGRVKGGLGIVAIVTCGIMGAISGSAFTGLAATGSMLIPEMVKRGYPRSCATALITASSILGTLIPPSTPMIIFGWVTNTNVLACFLSTVGPGILTIIIFCAINMLICHKLDMKLLPPLSKQEKRRQIISKGWKALPAILMPLIILGGIYSGATTPTEAAAVATVYCFPVGFLIYKGLKSKNTFQITKDSAVSAGTIMVMIMCSMMLSQTYVRLQVPQAIMGSIFGITQNKFLILLLINALLLFVGMIVNDTTGIILVAPLLQPMATSIGIHPVHYAAIFGVNLGIGCLTPPYASLLYLGMRVGKVEFSDILPYVCLFLLGYLPVMLATTYWPALSLFLPRVFGYV
ncbi:MAG: TRAP transporter large permease [Pyramidobacter sp.]|uniref:TRAP transporter large permease n=1 Tax=Pyramidobacter sp. TaxID=1943581 RepID=UPI002A81AB64|nr:TRAP transporter large permease [Pyramidobacter sp.]MDY4033091.1 TRAP transporter large permease [Pyramidobacter sp.]